MFGRGNSGERALKRVFAGRRSGDRGIFAPPGRSGLKHQTRTKHHRPPPREIQSEIILFQRQNIKFWGDEILRMECLYCPFFHHENQVLEHIKSEHGERKYLQARVLKNNLLGPIENRTIFFPKFIHFKSYSCSRKPSVFFYYLSFHNVKSILERLKIKNNYFRIFFTCYRYWLSGMKTCVMWKYFIFMNLENFST